MSTSGIQGDNASEFSDLSANGRFVVFESAASNLVSGDTNGTWDVFLRDIEASTTTRQSVNTAGGGANGSSAYPSISSDGTLIVFRSRATNLDARDTAVNPDIYLRNVGNSTTELISVGSNGESSRPAISADGQCIVYDSDATNLVSGDTNGWMDVFLFDTESQTTELVSVATSGLQGNGPSYGADVSADGRYVVFTSTANNLVSGDNNLANDIFLRDRQEETTIRVSVAADGGSPDSYSFTPRISDDGQVVSFTSYAENLLGPFEYTPYVQAYARDLQTEETTLVSRTPDGDYANAPSGDVEISGNGRYVFFSSDATDIVIGDNNNTTDIYATDLVCGEIKRVSLSELSGDPNGASHIAGGGVNYSGTYFSFLSDATNLIVNDSNGQRDVFRGTVDIDSDCQEPLAITKVGPEIVPAAVGANVPYSITVQNNTSSVAYNVEVFDSLPKALRFVSGSWSTSDPPGSGTCYGGDYLAACWVGDVAPGGTVTVALATTLQYVPVVGAVSNMACASAWKKYPACSQTATGVGAAVVAADLRMLPVAGPDSIDRILDSSVNYDVVATNDGPGAADGVVISTVLDANLRPGASTWQNSSGSSGGCIASGRTVACNVGTLSEGGSATAHITTTLANAAAPSLRSQACVRPADANLQNSCRDKRTGFSSSNRKVVFIQGINSGSDCSSSDGYGRVKWMEDYLTGRDSAGRWVARYVELFPRNLPSSLGDFRYFSYSGNNGCPGEMAEYGPTDTCNGIDDAADKLDDLIEHLIAQDPNVNLDLVAHSMGGVVAASWVVTHPDTARRHVNSVVTFDSPLKGLPMLNAIFLGTVLWGWNIGNACNATDSSVLDLYSGLLPPSLSVMRWQKAGGIVPFYTVDGGRSEVYLGALLEAVPGLPAGWPNDRTSMAGQRAHIRVDTGHSGVWVDGNDLDLKKFVGCAVTRGSDCSILDENVSLQTGEMRRFSVTVSPEDIVISTGTLWGEGTAETTLEVPGGAVIYPATQDPNVRHGADAGYQTYDVDNPQPGVWSIVVKAVDMPAGGGTVSVRADMVAVASPDEDEDGIPDGEDNCQIDNNADQSDVDADGLGDACDPDVDNDGVLNALDDCPYVTNPDQADLDGDGLGDACDGDNDNDHMPDAEEVLHACLSTSVDDSADDPDADGLANLEEIWRGTDPCTLDTDADGLADGEEVRVALTDPLDSDTDDDGVVDGTDNCPLVANANQKDTDGDGLGDACDSSAPVGGIAELPDAQADAALTESGRSARDAIAIAGLVLGTTVVLTSGAWYARKRRRAGLLRD